MVETLPVEIVKLAVVALAATATDAGTIKVGEAELESGTTNPPAGAAFDNVSVQVVLPFELKAATVHPNAVTVTGDCKEIVAVALLPFNDPVRVAF